jgi:2-oxoglutarate ferredoxin oxidoreductase subunit beta
MKTPVQVEGVLLEPFNPLATALALGATFVGRVFSGDIMQAKEVVKAAILHKGYALVDVFQPCVVFNKLNTYQWFKEHTYYVDEKHDKTDRARAFEIAFEMDKLALGVIYQTEGRASYETLVRKSKEPLFKQAFDEQKLKECIGRYR